MWISSFLRRLLRTLYVLHCLPLSLFQRSVGCIYVGLFPGSLFCPIYLSILFAVTTLSWLLCSFPVSLEVGYCRSSNFTFCPSILCWLFWVFFSPYWFQNEFTNIHKLTCWNFDRNCIKSIDQVGKNWHFDNIECSFPPTNIYLVFLFHSSELCGFPHIPRSVQSLSCVWLLCDPVDCSTPGFPVHHQLPELAQTHVHQVGDAIQPSHPLSSPSPPAFNLS